MLGSRSRLQAGQPRVGFGRGSFYFRSRGSPWNLNANPDHSLRVEAGNQPLPSTSASLLGLAFWKKIFHSAGSFSEALRTRHISWDTLSEEGRGQGGGWWGAPSIRPGALRAGLGLFHQFGCLQGRAAPLPPWTEPPGQDRCFFFWLLPDTFLTRESPFLPSPPPSSRLPILESDFWVPGMVLMPLCLLPVHQLPIGSCRPAARQGCLLNSEQQICCHGYVTSLPSFPYSPLPCP